MYYANTTGPGEDIPAHIPRGLTCPGVPRRDSHVAGPWRLPSDPEAAGHARTAVRAVLADWDLGHLAHTAELLVSELVGNALLHAEGPLHLTMERRTLLRCKVEDSSPSLPSRRSAAPDDEHGRGLELVHLLSSDWGIDPTTRGKAVWFELD